MKLIKTKAAYNKLMEDLLQLMNKGEANLNKAETEKLKCLSIAAQACEKSIYKIPG